MDDSPIQKILVIDDDVTTLGLIESILTKTGFQVMSAPSGAEGLHKLYQDRPHLILLAVAMSEMDGWQTYTHIRQLSDLPIIFVGSSNNAGDIVRGLNLGAVDYITKPVHPEVLVARARAALRSASPSSSPEQPVVYHDAYLMIDSMHEQVWVQGQEIPLTTFERRLFFFLFARAGSICTFEQILMHVWGWEYRESTQYVHVYISNLRHKIELDPKHPHYIVTEHRQGYRFKK